MPKPLLLFVLTVVGSPLTVSGSAPPPEDVPAQVVSRVAPTYPAQARREGIEGTVVVEFVIDETGTVRRPIVVESVPGLDEAALEALSSWTFEPARRNGQPIASTGRVPVKFELDEGARAAAAARRGPPIPPELSSPPPGLDLQGAVDYGKGKEKIPTIQERDEPCDVVDLAGPAQRVARLVREASDDKGALDPGTIRVQASATLTVFHRRVEHIVKGQRTRTNTCRFAIPDQITLVGKDGEELPPLGKVQIRRSNPDKKIQGAGVVAVATFDWVKALALSGGEKLIVAVEFMNDDHPARVEFDKKDLGKLTPEWAYAPAEAANR